MFSLPLSVFKNYSCDADVRSSETIVIFHLKTYVKLLSTLGLRKYFVSFVDTETEARTRSGHISCFLSLNSFRRDTAFQLLVT